MLQQRPSWRIGAPVTVAERNLARGRTAQRLGVRVRTLPIPPAELYAPTGWLDDPLWAPLFERMLSEVVYERWHRRYPMARAWHTDPKGPRPADYDRAAERAAQAIRNLAPRLQALSIAS